jgi:hypothetical protein
MVPRRTEALNIARIVSASPAFGPAFSFCGRGGEPINLPRGDKKLALPFFSQVSLPLPMR